MAMERLTGEYKGRYGIKTPDGFMPAYEMAAGDKTVETIAAFQAGIDRLAAYEDLGVTPEQIWEMDALYSELAKEAAGYKKRKRLEVAALDKCKPKSPYPDGDTNVLACARCGSGEWLHNEDGNENRFCGQCGGAINWSEDGMMTNEPDNQEQRSEIRNDLGMQIRWIPMRQRDAVFRMRSHGS